LETKGIRAVTPGITKNGLKEKLRLIEYFLPDPISQNLIDSVRSFHKSPMSSFNALGGKIVEVGSLATGHLRLESAVFSGRDEEGWASDAIIICRL